MAPKNTQRAITVLFKPNFINYQQRAYGKYTSCNKYITDMTRSIHLEELNAIFRENLAKQFKLFAFSWPFKFIKLEYKAVQL